MSSEIENVIIVGTGCSGLTAAIYTARANLNPLIIEGNLPGGQLTQTSHLAKLAMRDLTKRFPHAAIDPIPGPVTAELRKAWDLTGTLSLVCPEVLEKDTAAVCEVLSKKIKFVE